MALYIGFANTFYTLWDVKSIIEYGKASHGEVYSYEIVKYTYLQNLSLDIVTAQEKAKKFGCKFLEPNHDLFGRNKSWEQRNSRNYCSFNNNFTPYHPDTKECLSKISADEAMRLYKSWHFSSNIHVINRGIELGLLVRYSEGKIMTSQEYSSFQDNLEQRYKYKKMGETMEIEITANLNLSINNDFAILYDDKYGEIYFKDFKVMYYSGFEYGLPINEKGKAKRIKGKTIQLIVESREYREGIYELFVKSFKI